MRKQGDKILDNSYNTGQIDPEFFHSRDMKLKEEYVNENLEEYYNNEKYNRDNKLLSIVESLTQKTKYNIHTHAKKKLPKARLNEYFCYIVEGVRREDNTYTMVEMVVAVCEYIGCSYENMFKELNLSHKEMVLNELDEEYQVFSKMDIRKLF